MQPDVRKIGWLAALCLLPALSAANEGPAVTARYDGCAKPVRFSAEGAELQQVLTLLADKMGFVLMTNPQVSGTVTLEGEYLPENLFRQLFRGHNAVLGYQSDRDCPHQRRVTEVVLMKQGDLISSGGLVRYVPTTGANEGTSMPKAYTHIEDMEDHVSAAVARQAPARKGDMTPEQRAEFMRMKKEKGKWRDK